MCTHVAFIHVHVHIYVHVLYIHLLDISRQLACMKLGRRETYQPMQYCWAGCLGYPVHTCHLPIDIQQIYCSAQTGQHERLRHSCCPVWALQHICTCTCTCTPVHVPTNPPPQFSRLGIQVSCAHCAGSLVCLHA